MVSMLFRLLTLVSFLLMPVGMVSTPAMAADRPMVASSMPCEGHQEPSDEAPRSKAHCAACAALAQPLISALASRSKPYALLVEKRGDLLLGLEPEVATPPPKLA
jgi:hypothetical protein